MSWLGLPWRLSSKESPAMQEPQFQSPGLEDPLEEGKATHSSILPGEPHGQRSLAGYSSWGCTDLAVNEVTYHMLWLQSGHHIVNIFHLVGASISTNQLKGDGSEYYP